MLHTTLIIETVSAQFSSVTQSCPTLCDPMDCSMPGLSVHHQLQEFAQTHVHWVSDAIQPSHPLLFLLLLLSTFPSIRIFFNESVLYIGWPKYWSFIFSISPFNEYLGLISFRMDWLDLLAVQGILNAQSCPTLCDPMDGSTPGFPVHYELQEFAQTHVHWISDTV